MVKKFYTDKRKARESQAKAPCLSADDLGVCNCAQCGIELLGEKTRERLNKGEARTHAVLPPDVAGRINGRPLCSPCLAVREEKSDSTPVRFDRDLGSFRSSDPQIRSWADEASPWQQNNIRALEDGE